MWKRKQKLEAANFVEAEAVKGYCFPMAIYIKRQKLNVDFILNIRLEVNFDRSSFAKKHF